MQKWGVTRNWGVLLVPWVLGDSPPRRRGEEPSSSVPQPARKGRERGPGRVTPGTLSSWCPRHLRLLGPIPGWGCWLGHAWAPFPSMLTSAGEAPTPRARVGHWPQPCSLLLQGLGLRHHDLLLCADHLPLSLHCAEEVAPGDVGRCRGPPCLWGAEQDPSTGPGCAFGRWSEGPVGAPVEGPCLGACLHFPSGPPSPLLHPSGPLPQTPQIPPNQM